MCPFRYNIRHNRAEHPTLCGVVGDGETGFRMQDDTLSDLSQYDQDQGKCINTCLAYLVLFFYVLKNKVVTS